MKLKHTKATWISFLAAFICWAAAIAADGTSIRLIFVGMGIIFSILFVCFFFTRMIRKIDKKISSYRAFAVADICLGVCVSVYAVYDLVTDTGWFAGIVGALLLMCILPILLILLLADHLVYKYGKSKNK